MKRILLAALFVTEMLGITNLLTSPAYARGPLTSISSDSKFTIYYGNEYYTNAFETSGQPKPVDQWILNYPLLNQLIQFDVVVLQQNNILCTPEVIEYLKANGVDHVLGYISIGEDFSNTALVGDGSGPQALTLLPPMAG